MGRFISGKGNKKFGRGSKEERYGNKPELSYNELVNRLKKTKKLRLMKALINNFVSKGGEFETRAAGHESGTSRNYDCNGDGNIDILDIVLLINYVLQETTPEETKLY